MSALGVHGVLLTIGTTTRVKWWPNFETPAPTHTATISSFRATIRSTTASEAKKIKRGEVLLAAGGEEHDLVAQAHHDEQADQHEQRSPG